MSLPLGVRFEETILSETVTEFRASSDRRRSIRMTLALALVPPAILLLVWLITGAYAPPFTVIVLCTAASAGIVIYARVATVTEESVTVIQNFGIQLRKRFYDGSEYTKVRGCYASVIMSYVCSPLLGP
jgi:hypothetical protein